MATLYPPLSFTLGYMAERTTLPEKYVPAVVPGNVQLDWAKAHEYPCHHFNKNSEQFGWMEDVFWLYKVEINKPALENGAQVYFIAKGIDYEFEILLDGRLLLHQEGMFTPVRLNFTDLLSPEVASVLEIIIYPAPKAADRSKDKREADESVKPLVSYGWDWHPRLIVSGIFDECYLEVKPATHIIDAETQYVLSEDLTAAEITLKAEIENPRGRLEWKLLDENGSIVCKYDFHQIHEKIRMENAVVFNNPALWWPNEHGPQTLYTAVYTLTDENSVQDEHRTRLGFRRCKLVPNHNVIDPGFPKSANLPPITLEINNRRIFCKGSNWVEPEIFTGTITRETYAPLIQLAKDVHFNMLRAWGGCMVSKEAFFDLCDEMGLLVWQEFPLSCNNYRNNPHYLEVLEQESRSIIKRVRRHACLAIWCGGNELFNDWSGMDDQSHALRLLNANCYRHDPMTPFLPTSPIPGMGHGCYVFRYDDLYIMPEHMAHRTEGYDCLTAFIHAKNTAYTEFGCTSASDAETLVKIIPADELFPPKPGGAWQHHHGFYAWHNGALHS